MLPAERSAGSSVHASKRITQDHESFELTFDMLMGIRTAVGRFTSAAMPEEIGPAEFNQSWEGDFLARGTPETPAHHHSDFRFKDYSPLVFRQLRERFGITSQVRLKADADPPFDTFRAAHTLHRPPSVSLSGLHAVADLRRCICGDVHQF
jgi:hypothetical protein